MGPPRRNLWIILISVYLGYIVFSSLFVHHTPTQPPTQTPPAHTEPTTADLSYKTFLEYLAQGRISTITVSLDSMLQANDLRNPRLYYRVYIPANALTDVVISLSSQKNVGLSFTRTPELLEINRFVPMGQLPYEVRNVSYADFIRQAGENAFGKITLTYYDTIDVVLIGNEFKNIRYRVHLPDETAPAQKDTFSGLLEQREKRSSLVVFKPYAPPPSRFSFGTILFIAVLATLVYGGYRLWKKSRDQDSHHDDNSSGTFRPTHIPPPKPTPPENPLDDPGIAPGSPPLPPAEGDQRRYTFADIAGQEEAVEDAKDIVEYLKNPAGFWAVGAKMPKGLLLVGPPGTGKTLLARAIAGEAGVPFFSVSGSEFIEMYVGVGASRIRDLFSKARKASAKYSGALVFIDEIDSVGGARSGFQGGGEREHTQTLNQLFTEMDGFTLQTRIIVIAATNRVDILDPALLRPGRFTRRIWMDIPDRKGRAAILKVHMPGRPFEPSITADEIAKRTPLGFSGADLENVLNEAALEAKRAGRTQISMANIQEGIMRTIAGPGRISRAMGLKEKTMTAYHEAGHHYLRWFLYKMDPDHTDPPGTVTIIGRGQAAGLSISGAEEDRFFFGERYLKNQLVVAYGGRMAENIFFGDVTTGAENDIKQATSIAIKMIAKWGMGDREGLSTLSYGRPGGAMQYDDGKYRQYGEEIARIIDAKIKQLVDDAENAARLILEEGKDEVVRLAEALVEKETLEKEELDEIINGTEKLNLEGRFEGVKRIATWLAQPIFWPVKKVIAGLDKAKDLILPSDDKKPNGK